MREREGLGMGIETASISASFIVRPKTRAWLNSPVARLNGWNHSTSGANLIFGEGLICNRILSRIIFLGVSKVARKMRHFWDRNSVFVVQCWIAEVNLWCIHTWRHLRAYFHLLILMVWNHATLVRLGFKFKAVKKNGDSRDRSENGPADLRRVGCCSYGVVF